MPLLICSGSIKCDFLTLFKLPGTITYDKLMDRCPIFLQKLSYEIGFESCYEGLILFVACSPSATESACL